MQMWFERECTVCLLRAGCKQVFLTRHFSIWMGWQYGLFSADHTRSNWLLRGDRTLNFCSISRTAIWSHMNINRRSVGFHILLRQLSPAFYEMLHFPPYSFKLMERERDLSGGQRTAQTVAWGCVQMAGAWRALGWGRCSTSCSQIIPRRHLTLERISQSRWNLAYAYKSRAIRSSCSEARAYDLTLP